MDEEEDDKKNESGELNSESSSGSSDDEKSEKTKKKKKQPKIDTIKYFDPFREILGPDELLEFKGVHTKLGLNNSKRSNLYGRLKPKATDSLSNAIYQADLGGELNYKQT